MGFNFFKTKTWFFLKKKMVFFKWSKPVLTANNNLPAKKLYFTWKFKLKKKKSNYGVKLPGFFGHCLQKSKAFSCFSAVKEDWAQMRNPHWNTYILMYGEKNNHFSSNRKIKRLKEGSKIFIVLSTSQKEKQRLWLNKNAWKWLLYTAFPKPDWDV